MIRNRVFQCSEFEDLYQGERDARNRALGRAGEERIFAHERASLLAAGRTDLAERIRWMSNSKATVPAGQCTKEG